MTRKEGTVRSSDMKKREKNGVRRTDVRNSNTPLQGYHNYHPIRYDVCAREDNVRVKGNERESRARLLAENGGTKGYISITEARIILSQSR